MYPKYIVPEIPRIILRRVRVRELFEDVAVGLQIATSFAPHLDNYAIMLSVFLFLHIEMHSLGETANCAW